MMRLWMLVCVFWLGLLGDGRAAHAAERATPSPTALPHELACALHYTRIFNVLCADVPADKVRVVASDAKNLAVNARVINPKELQLQIKALQPGAHALQLSHADTGRVIAKTLIRVFTLKTTISRVIGISRKVKGW